MKQSYQPIETAAGLISGRDAIFLDEVRVSLYPRVLELRGELNSVLCSNHRNDNSYIKYSLTFSGVIAYAMTELDFKDHLGASSFDLVVDSEWLEEMGRKDHSAKVKPTHKHFLIFDLR